MSGSDEKKKAVVHAGPSSAAMLGVAFVVLKLCGVIDWSWWLVTLPFWGFTVFLLCVVLALLLVAGAAKVLVLVNRGWVRRRRG